MDATRTTMLNDIIKALDQTYIEFLALEGFSDNPATKAGFFVAAEQIVRSNPLPESEVQVAVLQYIFHAQRASLDVVADKVATSFYDVSNRMKYRRSAVECLRGFGG